jgi:hypothetical protein
LIGKLADEFFSEHLRENEPYQLVHH